MPELTPRVVFDCNLFVQGIASRNNPARKAQREIPFVELVTERESVPLTSGWLS